MTHDLNTVVSAMDSVFSRHDSTTGWWWRPLLRLLARGEPVTIAALAAATGRPGKEVTQAVSRLRDTEYDDEGRIVGYGITQRRVDQPGQGVSGREMLTFTLIPAV